MDSAIYQCYTGDFRINATIFKDMMEKYLLGRILSQNDLLESVAEIKGVDWSRVNAFHMDEYVGLFVIFSLRPF